MSLTCNCPLDAAIPDIPISACPSGLGQIQKVVFQRVFKADGTKNGFVKASADPVDLASWTPLLAAVDATKVVSSPYIQAPTSEAGAPRVHGGGNETLGGVEIIIGAEPSTFSGQIKLAPQTTIKALKNYMCEAVGVFLIDENGKIGLLADDPTTPANYYPIPVHALFVGDKMLGNLEAPDQNMIQWKFLPNWSDNLVIITPDDFNALTDLNTPVSES